MARIQRLRKYRLKGAQGTDVSFVRVKPDIGIFGDRHFALKRSPATPDTWSSKGKFYVCANTPQMATLAPAAPVGAQLENIGTLLGLQEPPAVLDTKGAFNISDTEGSSVSFLNLASVAELNRFMGVEVNPSRFRMNILLDGLEPFEELTWVNGFPGNLIIEVGTVPFRVDDACERCRAIEANPETGIYDLPVLEALDALMQERGYAGSPHRGKHTVMGILACPLKHGIVSLGDTVRLS